MPFDPILIAGSTTEIRVTLENHGNMIESFNVTVFSNEVEIQTKLVSDLDLNKSMTLEFTWDTTGVPLGDYIIGATTGVIFGESKTWDNTVIDGNIAIVESQNLVYFYPETTWIHPNQTFAITICVFVIENCFMGQVGVRFNASILEWVSGGFLSGNVVIGATPYSFIGRRTCYQAMFRGIAEGISTLVIDDVETTLYDNGLNEMPYIQSDGIAYVYRPDIAVTNVAFGKTVVCQEKCVRLNITVNGFSTESFDVTVYANATMIEVFSRITLPKESSIIIPLIWNTTGMAKGNYTISANATAVPDEANLTNNNFVGSWIIVSMIGDITGPDGYPDGKCDIRDIALVALYFGKDVPPAPPNCDITGPITGVPDGKIDIRDIATVALHFGEVDP